MERPLRGVIIATFIWASFAIDIGVFHSQPVVLRESQDSSVNTMYRLLVCLLLLPWCLMLKSFFIRIFAAKVYLTNYFEDFKVN